MSEENRTKRLLTLREEEPAQKKAALRSHLRKEIGEWVRAVVFALIAFVVIRSFLFTMIRVDGESMLETLKHGDRLFVSILDVKLGGMDAIDQGDVIICHYPGEGRTNFVKRVIAKEGDTVATMEGVTYVNGQPIEEDYVTHKSRMAFGPYTVPEGKLFVMGDNRANSRDSRMVGPLALAQVVGVARCVWWPLPHIALMG